MYQQRPLVKRPKARLFYAVTLLAWATPALVHQWACGQDLANAPAAVSSSDLTDGDKFVPGEVQSAPAGTLELRQDASVYGGEVKLRQLCRWSDTDAPTFTPVADLVIVRLSQQTPFRTVTVDTLRQTLHDAGVNVAVLNFSGATECTVSRSDAHVDPHDALQQWIDQQASGQTAGKASSDVLPGQSPPAAPAAGASDGNPIPAAAIEEKTDSKFHSLHDLLVKDVSERLDIPAETLQLTFSPEDAKVLSLVEPMFKFDIQSTRVRNLGNVRWDVTICTDTSNRKVSIAALAQAWEDQVIVAKPLAYKQILSAEDFTTRRVLTGSLPDQPLLRLDQCVGQQAAADLKPGTLMTARLVDPVPLVRAGQLVTVTLIQGTVRIRSVARALESGSLGQTVKVRFESALNVPSQRNIMDVTVTGVQEASLSATRCSADAVAGD